MRMHRARGAAYDLTREREWNWWRTKRGKATNGAVHHFSAQELAEFAEDRQLDVATSVTVRDVRHVGATAD